MTDDSEGELKKILTWFNLHQFTSSLGSTLQPFNPRSSVLLVLPTKFRTQGHLWQLHGDLRWYRHVRHGHPTCPTARSPCLVRNNSKTKTSQDVKMLAYYVICGLIWVICQIFLNLKSTNTQGLLCSKSHSSVPRSQVLPAEQMRIWRHLVRHILRAFRHPCCLGQCALAHWHNYIFFKYFHGFAEENLGLVLGSRFRSKLVTLLTRAQITYLNFGQVAGAFGGCCGTGSALSIFGVVQFGNTLSIKDSVAEKLQIKAV